MKSEGRGEPPFDKVEEDVAEKHEERREDIRDDVEERREDRAAAVESERSDRAEALEEERVSRAHEVEDLAIYRMRFVVFVSLGAAILAVALAVTSLVQAGRIDSNRDAIARIADLQGQVNADARERRSDTCRSFEQQHKQEIDDLKSRYTYLLGLSPENRRSNLNKTVAAQVPLLEKKARSDQDDFGIFVPKYCDDKGVGLPEPDPTVPKRPAALKPPKVPAPLP